LRRKQSFVWNATSLVPDFRRRQLELFRDYGAFTEIVVLETSWTEGLRRNKDRSAVVPEGVIDDMLGRFSPPSVRESHAISWLTI
jgi:predicted kinase